MLCMPTGFVIVNLELCEYLILLQIYLLFIQFLYNLLYSKSISYVAVCLNDVLSNLHRLLFCYSDVWLISLVIINNIECDDQQ